MSEPMKFYCDHSRHLVCKPYSIQNLHAMAHILGIKRCWFHRDHYDIPKQKIPDIMSKCIVVSQREVLGIIGRNIQKQFRWKK